MSLATTLTNDVELSPTDFTLLTDFIKKEAGLVYSKDKTSLVRSRLVKRLKSTGVADFQKYYQLITSPDGASEKQEFISALTTNVSHFFREAHHFEALRAEVLPVLKERVKTGHSVRIWSAGCSNGQEPYSIAMSLLHFDPDFALNDVKILATDIDPVVIEFAKRGLYHQNQIEGLPTDYLKRFAWEAPHDPSEIQMSDALKKLISFRRLNLLNRWPMTSKFDAIFCRNVLIYFDEATQNALWPRFSNALSSDGVLFIGHSERVSDPGKNGLKTAGVTTYRKL